MDNITYKQMASGDVRVYLGGKVSGSIVIIKGGYQYRPKGVGRKFWGKVFPTLAACKLSLETEPGEEEAQEEPQVSELGDLTGLSRKIAELIRQELEPDQYGLPAIAIVFTTPSDYSKAHWVTNTTESNAVSMFEGAAAEAKKLSRK